jgi:hypothetical protein
MNDDSLRGHDLSPVSALSDPAALWPLVDVLTKVLREDCDEQAAALVSGTSRELAILRAHLDSDAVSRVADERDAQEFRAGVDAIVEHLRSESDQLMSEVSRYQDEIASLVTQLGQRVMVTGGETTAEESRTQPEDGTRTFRDNRPGLTLAVAPTSQDAPPAPSSKSLGPPQPAARVDATTAPVAETHPDEEHLDREHRARWKGNVLVGAITLAVVLVVLAILGAL